jgi:hypothetical protein
MYKKHWGNAGAPRGKNNVESIKIDWTLGSLLTLWKERLLTDQEQPGWNSSFSPGGFVIGFSGWNVARV